MTSVLIMETPLEGAMIGMSVSIDRSGVLRTRGFRGFFATGSVPRNRLVVLMLDTGLGALMAGSLRGRGGRMGLGSLRGGRGKSALAYILSILRRCFKTF